MKEIFHDPAQPYFSLANIDNFPTFSLLFPKKTSTVIDVQGGESVKKNTVKILSVVIFLLSMIGLTLVAIPFIRYIEEPENFKSLIHSFGPWSFLLMLFIQVAQIVVALIPGEVIEFLAGTLYGWFGGLLFCLLGIAIGQTLIFLAVRFFGKSFVEAAAGSKAMQKIKFLHNEKKLKTVVFVLYLIPGTPKDLLTYAVPLTSVSLRDFLLISLFARIPSVVSSTYAGSAYAKNDYKTLLVAYGIILAVSLFGVLLQKFYETKLKKP